MQNMPTLQAPWDYYQREPIIFLSYKECSQMCLPFGRVSANTENWQDRRVDVSLRGLKIYFT